MKKGGPTQPAAEASGQNASGEDELLGRIGSATTHYGLGHVLPQILSFLLLPLYTFFLTPDDYGIIDLAAALGSFVVIAMRFGVPGAVTRFYFDHKEGPGLRDYVTTVHRFLLGSSLVMGAIALGVMAIFGQALVPGLPFWPFVVLAMISATASGNSDLQRRLIQAREQSRYAAWLNVSFGVASAALAVLFVAGFRWGAFGMVLSGTIAAVLFFFQAQWYLRRDTAGRFRVEMLGSSLRYALGILPTHVMGRLSPLVTRSILAGVGSLAGVGVYGLAYRFATPLNAVASAFRTAYLPIYFSVREASGTRELRRLAGAERVIWLVTMQGFLTIAVIGPPFVQLLTPSRFHAAAPLLPVLGLGFVVQIIYALVGPEIFYAKNTLVMPLVAGGSMVVEIGLTAVFASTWGPWALAWARVAGLVVSTGLAAYFSMRLVHFPHPWAALSRMAGLAGLLFMITRALPMRGIGFDLMVGIGVFLLFPVILWTLREPTIMAVGDYAFARLARKGR